MDTSLLSQLPRDFPWTKHIIQLETVESTNTYLKKLALQGAPHGTAVIARQQTGGRGRLGRSFHSPLDTGMYLSVLLRPTTPPDRLMHLTCAAGLAASLAVEDVCGIRPGLKWINDLVLGNKKLGGILAEWVFGSEGACVVIGIGINCGQEHFPQELADIATSLKISLGCCVAPTQLAARLLIRLWEMNDTLVSNQAQIMEQYRRHCVTLGKQVHVISAASTKSALALGIDDEGGLLVQYRDGSRETVQSGEVSVRGMFGYT